MCLFKKKNGQKGKNKTFIIKQVLIISCVFDVYLNNPF